MGAVRSHTFLLGGAAVGAGLTVVGVVGAAVQWWWLTVLAALLLGTAVLLVALDTDRRVRELRALVRKEIAGIDLTAGRAAPSQEDVVGTVRVLQAQYTARLDRLQDTVEGSLRGRDDGTG